MRLLGPGSYPGRFCICMDIVVQGSESKFGSWGVRDQGSFHVPFKEFQLSSKDNGFDG